MREELESWAAYCVSLQGGGQLHIGFKSFTSEYFATEVFLNHNSIYYYECVAEKNFYQLLAHDDEALELVFLRTPIFVLFYATFSPLFKRASLVLHSWVMLRIRWHYENTSTLSDQGMVSALCYTTEKVENLNA